MIASRRLGVPIPAGGALRPGVRHSKHRAARAAPPSPRSKFDFEPERRQVGVGHQHLEAEAQAIHRHAGKFADAQPRPRHARPPMERGFRAHCVQNARGYAHLVQTLL